MPLSLRRGTVTGIVERVEGLVRCEVDGEGCIAYPRLTGPVALGDDVLVNVQARVLGLGSGGFDVLYANLTRGVGLAVEAGAHVMTLPYTPLQSATRFAEETDPLADSLEGTPVICCSLHSQVAPAAAALAGLRVAYVQVAGGALPVSLSDAVRALKERRLLETAVAAAPCVDGDVQCAGPASALAWAAARGFDAVLCAVGPGIVGTGSSLGHGATVLADVANAATAQGGAPVIAVRYSDHDPRDRHRGVSHHSRGVLRIIVGDAQVAWPRGLAAPSEFGAVEVDVDGWQEACAGLPLEHMGRGPGDDPWFFAAAFAAGRLARQLAR